MRKILLFVLTVLLLSGLAGIVQAQGACPPSRLVPYQYGQVTPGTPNRVREDPSTSSPLESTIPGNGIFFIYGTGTCADGYLWASILYDDKVGWTVEAQGNNYFVEPVPPPDGAIVIRAYITDVAWSSDGHTIALATNAGVYLLDARLSTPIPKQLTEDQTDEVAFNPTDPNMLATSAAYGMLRIWDLSTKKVLYESITGNPNSLSIEGNVVGYLQFTSDGKLMFASSSTDLNAYDTTSWQPARVLQNVMVMEAAMSPDGQQIAISPLYPDKPYLTDWSGNQTPLATGDLTEVILHMRFSPDSKMLAMDDNKGHVARDVVATGQSDGYAAKFTDDYHLMNGLAFSPDGKFLTIGDFTNQSAVQRLMNAATMQQIGTLTPDRVDQAKWFAFSPDGSKVASVFDNVLLIVNTADMLTFTAR